MSGTVFIRDGDGWHAFGAPERVVTALRPDDVRGALAEVDSAVRSDGYWAAGLVAYEAAAAFGLPVKGPDTPDLPLVWFGLYAPGDVTRLDTLPASPADGGRVTGPWTGDMDRAAYESAYEEVHRRIGDGETYQVNLTMRLRAPFTGDAFGLFDRLQRAQAGAYSAWLDLGRYQVASASPELFFEREGRTLRMRPMKGTMRRGRTVEEDERLAAALKASAKDRAENVMIVDMVRNDLGRVAQTGSVHVPVLFAAERYPTVWQLTSTVEATEPDPSVPLPDLFAALFPCASVTGAPKHHTMEIIREVEHTPRGVYTGAIGWVAPSGDARFSVAIRTLVVDTEADALVYGTGGGVVWDSSKQGEYEEALLKAAILEREVPEFELLETLRWTPRTGYHLLDRHLARMEASAGHFSFTFDRAAAEAVLAAPAELWERPMRVRLLLTEGGTFSLEATPMRVSGGHHPWRLALAPRPVSAEDPFLFHKTTHRTVYAEAANGTPITEGSVDGPDDVLFYNEEREVTESLIGNLVIERGGFLWTPPVSSGLLAGTMRAHLLQQNRIRERVIHVDDLAHADTLWVVNSVRGWMRTVLQPAD